MSVQLLDKTRKINKLLHNSSSSKVVFNDICQVLMETLSSNILVLSKKGKVLGISLCPGVEEITELIEDNVGGHIDSLLNERFLGVLSTKENVNLQTLGFEHVNSSCYGIINPIDIAGERLGTVFMYRNDRPYDIEDIIVSEYGTTVVGLEMMRAVHEENAEEDRKQQVVKSAFNTLSFSETGSNHSYLSMSLMVRKAFWLQARLQTVWVLRDQLLSMHFVSSKVPELSSPVLPE